MRFPTVFSRWKGAGQPASVPILLGGDTVPAPTGTVGITRVPAPAVSPRDPALSTVAMPGGNGVGSNVLTHKFSNVNGWPCHRIAVVYDGSRVVTPIDLAAALFVYDQATERWYRMHSAATVALKEGIVTFFDTLGLIDVTNAGVIAPSGSEQMMLIVTDPGGAVPDGQHVFAMGADLTTIGM